MYFVHSTGHHVQHTSSLSIMGKVKFFLSNLLPLKENDVVQNAGLSVSYLQTEASSPRCPQIILVYAVQLFESHSVISGLFREVDENCALQGYYAACSDISLPMFQHNLSVPTSRFNQHSS
jgi:hypothetical protein